MGECRRGNFDILPLYMGKSLDELKLRSVNFVSEKIKALSIFQLAKSGQRLLQEAKAAYKKGDQEMAYIVYKRFFAIITLIRQSCDYKKFKNQVFEIVGSFKEQKECLNRINLLSKSLEKRYKQLAAEEKISNRAKPEIPSTKSKPSACLPSAAPSICRRYITCDEFHVMINTTLAGSTRPKEIIIDSRPYIDYYESRITHPFVINIDEEQIQLGATVAQITSTFTHREQEMWKIRGNMENVIIVDWNTIEDEPIHDSPLHILMSILTLWDPDVVYPSLKFLKGGYAEFLKRYPKNTTNSKVKIPPRICPAKDGASDYPVIAAIPMEDELVNVHQKSVPVIDCNTDPNSLKKYNTKIIKEMVGQREELADKSINLEKKRHVLEEKIRAAVNEQERAKDEQTKEEAVEKVNQLIYEIMELGNSIHDVQEENIIVSKQINEQQASVPDAIPIDKIKEIEKKEREAQKLNKINERLVQEKRLSETVAIKPVKSMRSNIQQELKPGLPQVNEVVDRGITGLRNLGRTCYMNSIFQCISNTNSLTISFINKVYRKYMSKSDAPENLIVEHVANLVRTMWSGKHKKLSPRTVLDTFKKIYDDFQFNEDQDSFDFLTMLLDTLHSALRVMPHQASSANGGTAEIEWMSWKAKNESIIADLFYGQMKTTIKCTRCGGEIPEYNEFRSIFMMTPTNMFGKHRRSKLSDHLNYHFKGSHQKSTCPFCGQFCDSIVKRDIARLPSILVLVFYRETGTKNYIDFPIENLQMNDYVAPSELRNIQNNHTLHGDYNLYGIVNHYWHSNFGHFSAFCRNVILKRWFHFDDATVSVLRESELVSSAAYVLFYSKLPESVPPRIK